MAPFWMRCCRRSWFHLVVGLFWCSLVVGVHGWEATWESLDSRPLPAWYDEAKFGIFLHWGVYSVPSYVTAWFEERWLRSKYHDFVEYVNKTERRNFAYNDYAERFDATLYRPQEWSELFAETGAQYVVLTSKHHEGFCNWDSRNVASTRGWNSMDVGPRRDLVGELGEAVKQTTSPHTHKPLRYGLYHSMYEWFHPAYLYDRHNNYTTQTFPHLKPLPELYDLVNRYEPELIWSDGAFEAHSDYWSSTSFLAWYATNSTVADTAIWNDRWGSDSTCVHGSYRTCTDHYSPGKLLGPYKWEDATMVDTNAWEWSRPNHYQHYRSVSTILHELIATIAFNGNYILDVGPAADGTIPPILVDRLRGIGDWITVNGQAIYGTRPWAIQQNETDTYYTTKNNMLYGIVTQWPSNQTLVLPSPIPLETTRVHMLGVDTALEWKPLHKLGKEGIQIVFPRLTPNLVPCRHAWTLALTNIQNYKQYEGINYES